MNNYTDLIIWEKGMEVVELVYQITKFLPNDERFGLTSQIKRSSISIPSNIAEGAGRNSTKEFTYFLSIANGSTTELETQIILIKRLKLASEEKTQEILRLCSEIKRMNFSLQKSLK